MLKPGEIVKIKEKTEFDFDTNKWLVPAFYLRNKEVVLPKIRNPQDLISQELDSRELFMGSPTAEKREDESPWGSKNTPF